MSELKACPFCGNRASLHEELLPPYLIRFYSVVCTGSACVSTTTFAKPELAIAAWNRRAQEFPVEEFMARVRKSVRRLKAVDYGLPVGLKRDIDILAAMLEGK